MCWLFYYRIQIQIQIQIQNIENILFTNYSNQSKKARAFLKNYYYKQKLDECDSRRRWQTANDLLPSNDNVPLQSESENEKLCSEFSKFSINKRTASEFQLQLDLKVQVYFFFQLTHRIMAQHCVFSLL